MALNPKARKAFNVAGQYAQSHAYPNPILFHWTNGASALFLCASAVDESLFQRTYHQMLSADAAAGPGMYVSESMADSAGYGSTDQGSLIQVSLPEGIPWLDMQDSGCTNLLRHQTNPMDPADPRVGAQDIYLHAVNDRPPVLVRFRGTWGCLKTAKGCNFRLFDGRGKTIDQLREAYQALLSDHTLQTAAATFLRQMKEDYQPQITA